MNLSTDRPQAATSPRFVLDHQKPLAIARTSFEPQPFLEYGPRRAEVSAAGEGSEERC
jgi:hypothetical protein